MFDCIYTCISIWMARCIICEWRRHVYLCISRRKRYGYRLTIFNLNFPKLWLNHQHECYYYLKVKHIYIYTCMQKPGMNHQRQLWEQMVSNGWFISSCLLVLILTIIVHMVWKIKSSNMSWLLIITILWGWVTFSYLG